ncbi:hypothetical protein ABRP17_016560 [Stenotrophomonas sp. WHRI 8082]|uniref:hypothetical protein n=1 Tax=Stenotrophomonas sp. WHRI 8082 TaxID=3162571 RepID=UPI0032ED0B70
MAKPTDNKTGRPDIDWERIEADYRAGLLSVREIAAEHGITHGAINKRAKRDSWTRDLGAKIKAKADALVSKEQVSKEVSTEAKLSERILVEASAKVIADVRLSHRKDIARARALAMSLLEELESQTGHVELVERLDELVEAPEKLQALYRGVTSLPGRTKTMKDLADSLAKLVGMERDAYGIEGGKEPASSPQGTGVAIYLPANGR